MWCAWVCPRLRRRSSCLKGWTKSWVGFKPIAHTLARSPRVFCLVVLSSLGLLLWGSGCHGVGTRATFFAWVCACYAKPSRLSAFPRRFLLSVIGSNTVERAGDPRAQLFPTPIEYPNLCMLRVYFSKCTCFILTRATGRNPPLPTFLPHLMRALAMLSTVQ